MRQGKISPEEFRAQLKRYIKVPITDEELDTAWMAMLMETPDENIELLKNLKSEYRTFLLSNTNAIHVERYGKILKEKFGLDNGLSTLFENVYYSHKVGMKKPDINIYKLLIDENGLKPEETLFIDDSIQNLESAKKLGINVFHFKAGFDLFSVINTLIFQQRYYESIS